MKFPEHFTSAKLLEMARGDYERTDHPREGMVVRSKSTDGPWISFKVINNGYLEFKDGGGKKKKI